jgi:O-antigen ligase
MIKSNFIFYIKRVLFIIGIYGDGLLMSILSLFSLDYYKGYTKFYWIIIFIITIIIFTIDMFFNSIYNKRNKLLLIILPSFVFLYYLIELVSFRNYFETLYSLYLFGAISISSYIIGIIVGRKANHTTILFKDLKYINLFITLIFILSLAIEFKEGSTLFQTLASTQNHLLIGYTSLTILVYNIYSLKNNLFIYSKKYIINNLIIISLIVINLMIIIFSGSRGAFITANIFIIYAFLSSKKIWLKIIGIMLMFCIALIFFNSSIILKAFINKNQTLWFGRLTLLFSDESRFYLYRNAFNEFLKHPILGSGMYNTYVNYPHNLTLELLSEWGIIGTLFFFYILIKVILKFLNFYKKNNIYYAVYLWFFVEVLIKLQFSGTFKNDGFLWFLLGLGLTI